MSIGASRAEGFVEFFCAELVRALLAEDLEIIELNEYFELVT